MIGSSQSEVSSIVHLENQPIISDFALFYSKLCLLTLRFHSQYLLLSGLVAELVYSYIYSVLNLFEMRKSI